jgi:hypothetical protein
MYDDFLRDVGVNITQFSQLRPIRAQKEISVSTLGRVGIASTHHRDDDGQVGQRRRDTSL